MFREPPVQAWGESKRIAGRAGGVFKIALNLLLVTALVVVLGPGRQLFYADMGAAQQARAVERLVEAFDAHLARLGVVVGKTAAGGEGIQLAGPPNGTLYEPEEEITLRWSSSEPLKTGESYWVVAAYYKWSSLKMPVQPAFRYFSTTSEFLQLPVLDVDPSLPIIAWAVYVGSGANKTPTGTVSGTYRLLHIVRPGFLGVYLWDWGF